MDKINQLLLKVGIALALLSLFSIIIVDKSSAEFIISILSLISNLALIVFSIFSIKKGNNKKS